MNEARVLPVRLTALDAVYGALFRPNETFLGGKLSLRPAVAIVLVVSLITAFETSGGKADLLPLALMTSLGWLLWSWLGITAVVLVVVRLFYKVGEFAPLCAGLGLALAPLMLSGPVHVLMRLGTGGIVLGAIANLLLFVWWLRLVLLAVRGAAGLSGRQAVWALAATELIAVGLPVAWMLLLCLAIGLGISRAI